MSKHPTFHCMHCNTLCMVQKTSIKDSNAVHWLTKLQHNIEHNILHYMPTPTHLHHAKVCKKGPVFTRLRLASLRA